MLLSVSILKHKLPFVILLLVLLYSCTSQNKPDAQQLVAEAIAAHGGEKYNQGLISFRLNQKLYRVLRDGDAFVYSRTFTDTTGQRVHDVLRNSGFIRTVNDEEVELTEQEQQTFASEVNSAVQLALLPYGFGSTTTQKEYVGEAMVEEEPYHKVRITPEGSEQQYVLWVHQRRHVIDYLAYTCKEQDTETRFRKALNAHEVGGILFQDYLNYTSKETFGLENYDKAFETGKLEKVSEIILEDVKVEDLPQL